MNYKRIRNLREDCDFTQTYIADYLQISQRAYSHYENGERGIPVEILCQLADLYHTSTDYLLERTNIRNPYPK